MESTETITVNNHKIAVAKIDCDTKDIVIFCHGYRDNSTGPNRFFVRAARQLAAAKISSLRFDQFGSGNSGGDFVESSFNDWVTSTIALINWYTSKGYRISLFGQSMGASTTIMAASKTKVIAGVAWVPDASVDTFVEPETGMLEECCQIVSASFWREAHNAHIAEMLNQVNNPMLIIQCENDEYVSAENQHAITDNAQTNHKVTLLPGLSHSSWTYDESSTIINDSVNFLLREFAVV
jgi:esterase/lipase